MIADAQAVIGTYLREHPDVVALDARVSVKPPRDFKAAWIIVTQLAASDRSASPDHLMAHLLQFDCYATNEGGSVEADLMGRTVRAAIRALTADDLDDWVPSVITLNGPRNLGPDTDFEPAKDRTLVEADILLHPKGLSS